MRYGEALRAELQAAGQPRGAELRAIRQFDYMSWGEKLELIGSLGERSAFALLAYLLITMKGAYSEQLIERVYQRFATCRRHGERSSLRLSS